MRVCCTCSKHQVFKSELRVERSVRVRGVAGAGWRLVALTTYYRRSVGTQTSTHSLCRLSPFIQLHGNQPASLSMCIYCRGAFGGPSPASLTACMAPPPRVSPPSPSIHTQPGVPALIYASVEHAEPKVLHVGAGLNACRTRVGDRHARVAGCGDLGRQSP